MISPLPIRFITVKKYAELTGVSENAVTIRLSRGVWHMGREVIYNPANKRMVDLDAVNRWEKRDV